MEQELRRRRSRTCIGQNNLIILVKDTVLFKSMLK